MVSTVKKIFHNVQAESTSIKWMLLEGKKRNSMNELSQAGFQLQVFRRVLFG